MDKIYVIAGNHAQYDFYIRRKIQELIAKGNHEVTLSHFVYVSSPDTLRGLRNVHGFFIGSYRERSDLQELIQVLRIVNNIPNGEAILPPLLMPLKGELRMVNGQEQVYNGDRWIPLVQ